VATTDEVPGRFDVAINGRGFMLMEDGEQPALVRQSLRQQREQAAGANANIGEATVNPEGFWRRSIDDWSHGAGQTYYDRADSDPARFRVSSNVDVFSVPHTASLSFDTDAAATLGSAGEMIQAGARVYVRDGDTIKYTASPLTIPWSLTTVTGTSTGSVSSNKASLATDGTTLYIAYGANGIYSSSTSSSTAASFVTGTVQRVWFVKGRLIAASGASVYNPTAAGALPAALLTLGTGWEWISAAEGSAYIYLMAVNGQRTYIYKTAIKPDGTALDVPVQVADLATGQTGVSIHGYLGFIFVVSSAGIQMVSADSNGDLTFGDLIPLSNGSRGAFAAYGRFVWTTHQNEISSNGCLVKLDLSTFTAPNTPAYASDIEVANGDRPSAAINWGDRRIVLANELTAYVQSTDRVTSGEIRSGAIAHDLIDKKTPVSIDLEALTDATFTVAEHLGSVVGGPYTLVGTRGATDTEMTVTGIAASRQFELRTVLAGSGAGSPQIYRHTFKVEPGVNQGDYVVMRLRLYENVVDHTGTGGGYGTGRTPASDLTYLRGLQQARTVVDVQEGSVEYTATMRDMDWQAETRTASADDGSWNGVATVRLKVVA
jgi:hypothetical protein